MVHVEGKRMDSQQTAQSLVDKASLRASALHNPERRGDTEGQWVLLPIHVHVD